MNKTSTNNIVMIKKLFIPFLLFFAISANAQLNNSWIDYSKTYYKFRLAADNICRIPQTALASVGLAATNADYYQLWKNGQQIRLYTSVSAAPLGATDFIEFFGEMNDGKADNALYRDPQFQLADKYSLETDTAVYFLTVNPVAGSNLRYTSAVNPSPGSAVPDPYFMRKIDLYYKNQIGRGFGVDYGEYVHSSSYDNGEGLVSTTISAQPPTATSPAVPNTYTETINGLNVYAAGPSNSLSFRAKLYFNTDHSSQTLNISIFNNSLNSISSPSPLPFFKNNNLQSANFIVNNLPLSYFQNTSSVNINFKSLNNNGIPIPTNLPGQPGYNPNLPQTAGYQPPIENMVLATIGITYPATFNFNNQKSFYFELAASTTGNYLLIDNFNYGSVAPVLYDINNGRRYIGDILTTPGKVKFVLPASVEPVRKFLLNNVENSFVFTVNNITTKTFVNYNTAATRGDYIIISNPALYNDGNGVNNVELYRAYRSSADGGNYNAKIYDVNELTDQFAFGIKSHPAAIRDFVRYMDIQYPIKPKAIFIIGRGLSYQDKRNLELNAANYPTTAPIAEKLDFVPTFGWPPSDILLVSQPGTTVPITPVGRLGAINGTEVGYYYQKVLQYEQVQKFQSPAIIDKAWMKSTMQIVGGKTDDESNLFDAYMGQYKDLIKDTLFGGAVEKFNKTSSSTIQQASSQRISQMFAEGLGFISYFGHSSATTFEFNLSDPSNYANAGKYPFFNISGCTAGNFYNYDANRLLGGVSLSEKYIIANQKGSIGFLADSHFGIPGNLHSYNYRLHQDFCRLMYGKTVGDQIKEVTNNQGGLSSSLEYSTRLHLEEINLHGDPAIKINNFPKPDYVIEPQLVKLSPNIITVANATFNVKVQMQNIGRAINDSMKVYVKRLLPNTTVPVTIIDTMIFAIRNTDSLSLTIPIINPITERGLNKLIIELDYTNKIPEIYETNNKISVDFFIFENTLSPVYPYNYAIVNTQNITYAASTANPLIGVSNYTMEIDTTESFNSPFKKTYNKTGLGGVIEFAPTDITFTDSMVYYWRTAVVPPTGNPIWNGFSFVYLASSTAGFSQSHYFQFLKSTYADIRLDADRKFKYNTREIFYNIRTAVYPNSSEQSAYSISNGGFIEQDGLAAPFATNNNALRFYIIDSLNIKPIFNQFVGSIGLFGSNAPIPNNAGQHAGYFQFDISTQAKRQIVKLFLDSVVQGNVIVMVNGGGNTNTHYPLEWSADPGASLYQTLKQMGFSQIDNITSHIPFVFAVRKGSSVPITQTLGAYGDLLNVGFPVFGTYLSGQITSDVLGPAKKWNSLHWKGAKLENANNDKTAIQVIGIPSSGIENILATVNVVTDTTLAWIDPITYPRLRLKMFNTDSITATPNQLKYWILNADLLPEGAVAPNILFTMKDTVEAGEPINFSVAFKNVSKVKFDSLMKINLRIKTSNNYDSVINIPKGKILIAGDTLKASYTIPSEKYQGSNTLFIDFNPNNDQSEQYHFNNILYKEFYVKNDPFNPLLDVTFDGVHILNRDIVSSKPDILIKLKDENRFLALKDTSLIKVQIKFPKESNYRNYYFGTDTMRFNPANLSAGENTASINFRPYLKEDGDYELMVTGKDVAGNPAGSLEYHSTFSVINKAMISEMLNYPNPFTSSTAFVFTLTGSQVPQNLRIQILTITGKVVKEITKQELGSVHVGRNITDYKWDGTDMYGQKLANGVYIYRVITNLNGKSLEKYKAEGDDTDKYFNKGYGKMYLMR